VKFGPVATAQAEGAILAHAVVANGQRLKKGRRLSSEDCRALEAAGQATVIVARLDAGDVAEDEAAARLAGALAFAGAQARPAATGRVNIHADAAGVFTVDRALVDAVNRVDPGITLATLADHVRVEPGQMVATVKIIPFAVPAAILVSAERAAAAAPAFAVHGFAARRVGLVQTTLPGVKPGVLDKTTRVTADRLARSGSTLAGERRCPHDGEAVAAAIAALSGTSDLVVVFGASAMTDPDDVVPDGIRRAGGTVERTGMPVDPGNLLVLGKVGAMPVIGAPGCARSPRDNGFDWVLDRMLAGLPVDSGVIAGLGVGGLLMEIPTRPSPRDRKARLVGVVLAAGQSSRMGGPNKLLAHFDGEPLVRRVAARVAAARVARTIVVTGHQKDAVEAALAGLDLAFVHNPSFAEGLSTSLRAGVAAADDADGVLIVLADMPAVATADLDQLIAAFGAGAIVRATADGRRGNPVILPRALFARVAGLSGDSGARHLLEASDADIVDVEIGAGAVLDVDTPEALAAAGGKAI